MKKEVKIIFFIVILLLLFLITFGLYKQSLNTESVINENKMILDRLKKLNNHIQKQKKLKNKLDKIFKYIYFSFRVLLLFIYFFVNFILYNYFEFNTLSALLNVNEVFGIFIILAFFVIYGDIRSLFDVIDRMKNYIKYRVYKKYINIEKDIDDNNYKAVQLEQQLNKNNYE